MGTVWRSLLFLSYILPFPSFPFFSPPSPIVHFPCFIFSLAPSLLLLSFPALPLTSIFFSLSLPLHCFPLCLLPTVSHRSIPFPYLQPCLFPSPPILSCITSNLYFFSLSLSHHCFPFCFLPSVSLRQFPFPNFSLASSLLLSFLSLPLTATSFRYISLIIVFSFSSPLSPIANFFSPIFSLASSLRLLSFLSLPLISISISSLFLLRSLPPLSHTLLRSSSTQTPISWTRLKSYLTPVPSHPHAYHLNYVCLTVCSV